MRRILLPSLVMILLSAPMVWSQGKSALTLEVVLQQLDDNARDYHSMTANVDRTKVTVVVNDKSTESGKIWARGDNMRIDLESPDARTVLRRGDKLYIYTPGLKRVEEYDLGKHRDMVDQFLLLGFGTSGEGFEQALSDHAAGGRYT